MQEIIPSPYGMKKGMSTNWQEIKDRYISTNASCKELASEFGVKESTVSSKCKREKWRDERAKFAQKCTEEIKGVALEENIKTFKKASEIIRQELMEELELNIDIRKSFNSETQWGEKRLATCLDNNRKIIETLDRMAHPQNTDEKDNNITVVLSDDKMKEYFK